MNISMNWMDVSVTLKNGIVNWPEDPEFIFNKISSIENGDEINLSSFSTCSHIGTHVDAPLHYFKNGNDVTSLPLDKLTGIVKVIEINNKVEISVDDLKLNEINKGDRIFFKTKHSSIPWWDLPFDNNFVGLSTEAALYLKNREIVLAGIDYLSISGIENSAEVHETLLTTGIIIVEGLNLSEIAAGNYEMICLPLKIQGAEGAPARVILRGF